jgi:PAS domain S-box-containing protein
MSDENETRQPLTRPAAGSDDVMTLINRNYVYEFATEDYCRAHGKDWKEIINRTVASIWGQETFNGSIKQYLDQCFAGKEVHYERWFEFPGQEPRCYHVSYYPYFNEKGNVTHVAVSSHDITDRKNQEKAP